MIPLSATAAPHHRRTRLGAVLMIIATLIVTGLPPVVEPAGAERWAGESLPGGIGVTHVGLADGSLDGISAAAVDASIAVPEGATIAVVTWEADPSAGFLVQALVGADVTATYDGVTASGDAPDLGEEHSTARMAAAPIWVAPGTTELVVRPRSGAPASVRIDFLTVPDRPVADAVSSSADTTVSGAAPAVRPNEDWGNPGWVYGNETCEDGPRVPGYLDRAAIHHTVNSNTYPPSAVDDLLVGIFYSHTQVNEWCDIGYNFVIDRFGTIWEGRAQSIEKPIQAGHTSGINSGSVGIALLGSHGTGPYPAVSPIAGTAERIASIVSWKFSDAGAQPDAQVQVGVKNDEYVLHGQRLVVPAIYGHRDVEATSCPGDLAIGLVPQVRKLVQVTTPANPTVLINNQHADVAPSVVGTVDVAGFDLLVGDWNGDGTDTFGYYQSPNYYLWNSMHSTEPDLVVKYGKPGDTALVGDWDGDGVDTIGIRRANVLHLRNSNTIGPADHFFSFGKAGDEVLVGDWDGDDVDTVGTRRGNIIYLNNAFRSGNADVTYGFGKAVDNVIVGDWDGDRRDTLGVRRGATMFLGNLTISGPADLVYDFADADTHIEYGDWNGDWITTPLVIAD